MYNFKQLTGNTKFLSYKEWKPSDFVVGKIERFSPNSKNTKVTDVVVTILESNILNERVTLSPKDLFTINGTTALQKALDTGVEEGDIIKVIYLGKETVKTGPWKGTMANKLEVYLSPATSKETVPSLPTNTDNEVL